MVRPLALVVLSAVFFVSLRGSTSRFLSCLRRTEYLKNGKKNRDAGKKNESKSDFDKKRKRYLLVAVHSRQQHHQPRRQG